MIEDEFNEKVTEAYEVARESYHIWLNAFSCIQPTDEFLADVGMMVVRKVMETKGRQVVLTVNAS